MRDDAIGPWRYGGTQKKPPGKFFTYDEHGWSVILERHGEFEAYLSQQKMSGSAVRTYPAHVADFYVWMQEAGHHQPPRHLYRDHVLQYRDHLVARRVKPQTINHKLSALKKYNAYLIVHKHQRGEVFRRGDFLRIPQTAAGLRHS